MAQAALFCAAVKKELKRWGEKVSPPELFSLLSSELNALYEEMNPLGLTIFGFPCNQFGKQEPGQRHEILPGLKWEIFVFHCTSSLPHRKHCLKNTHEWIRVDEGHGFPENSIGFWCDNIKFPSIESHAYRKAVYMCCKVRSFKAACRQECAITVNPLSINKTSLKHESIFWQFLFESLCSTPRTYVSDCISHHRSIAKPLQYTMWLYSACRESRAAAKQ